MAECLTDSFVSNGSNLKAVATGVNKHISLGGLG